MATDTGTLDAQGLLDALSGGAEWLQANVDAVNALNVYPVPDGDTGTNMMLTIQTALRDGQENPGDGTVGAMSYTIGQGALRGARGNSGVILSQYLKGFAQGLDGVDIMDGPSLAKGLAGRIRRGLRSHEQARRGHDADRGSRGGRGGKRERLGGCHRHAARRC